MLKKISENDAVARTAPMVYTVVTCLDENGKPNALGVSWVMRTSFEPLLMLISIDHGRYSHKGISKNGEFVINYPSALQQKGAWVCGTTSGRDTDKVRTSGLSFIRSEKVQAPTIDDVVAAFECKVVSQFETGDHTVFVGKVVATRGNPEEERHLYVNSQFQIFALDNTMEGTSE